MRGQSVTTRDGQAEMAAETVRKASGNDITALTDGRFVAALFVLLANDHWLKAEYGNWLTGKLSDVAGLIMLPVVVVATVRLARLRAAVGPIFAAIGTWFTAMKLWPTAAVATERLAESLTGVDHQIIVDPTDLIGLGGLWVAWRVIAAPRPLINARLLRIGLLALGLVATVATSSDYGEAANDLVTDEATGEVSAIRQMYYYEDATGLCEAPASTLPSAVDDFDAEADLTTDDGSGVDLTEPLLENYRADELAACRRFAEGRLGVGEFDLESCPDRRDFACVRAAGAAIEVSAGGSSWKTEWALDPLSPTTYDVVPEFDYYYEPAVKDLVVDRWGTTHVTYRTGLYVTRSAEGEWTPPFTDYRPIGSVAPIVAFITMLSSLAIAQRRSNAKFWWMVPLIAVAGYVALIAGMYREDDLLPIGELVGLLAIVVGATSICWVIVARYRKEIPGQRMNLVLAVASAAVSILPFIIWKNSVTMAFPWTWTWLLVAALSWLATDWIIGRRIAALPMPPPPIPSPAVP